MQCNEKSLKTNCVESTFCIVNRWFENDKGENDFNFAPMAPAQADRFENAVRIHSSVAGHELPVRSDQTFNSILNFITAGLN